MLGAPGLEHGAAGQLRDDPSDDLGLALELELAEVGEVGDPHRVPASGRLLIGGAEVGDHPPPVPLGERGPGVPVQPIDRAPLWRPAAVELDGRVGGEELEGHPRSFSWSGS